MRHATIAAPLAACWLTLSACLSSQSASPAPPGDGGAASDASAHLDGAPLGDASSSQDGAATPPGPPTSVSVLGASPIASPQHLAVDPATGNVYVASFAGSYSVLSPSGVLLGTYGASGLATLKSAVGIALDSAGNVYVGDYGASAVLKFDSSGTFHATFNGSASQVTLGRITGVAVDGAGIVYAADDDKGRIVKFDATGNVVGQLATVLDGGAAAGTTALAFDGADLWVAKYYDHSVLHLSPSGAIVASFGTLGTSGALGTFSQPYAIAVANHVVYVADDGANALQALTTGGTFAWTAGAANDAGAAQPTGVAVSRDGSKLYVSDAIGNRVVVYSLAL